MLVIRGYVAKEVENEKEAEEYIMNYMNQYKLSRTKVFDSTQNGIRVLVYQYSTLYKETFLITDGYRSNSID